MNKAEKTRDGQMMKVSATTVTRSPRTEPSSEGIAGRAYELFLARGAEHGHDAEDWYQAEQELRSGKN